MNRRRRRIRRRKKWTHIDIAQISSVQFRKCGRNPDRNTNYNIEYCLLYSLPQFMFSLCAHTYVCHLWAVRTNFYSMQNGFESQTDRRTDGRYKKKQLNETFPFQWNSHRRTITISAQENCVCSAYQTPYQLAVVHFWSTIMIKQLTAAFFSAEYGEEKKTMNKKIKSIYVTLMISKLISHWICTTDDFDTRWP